MLAQLVHAVLAQADAAHQVATAAPLWAQVLGALSPLTLLGFIWFAATYKRDLDRVKRIVTPDDADEHLGSKVKVLAEKMASMEAAAKTRVEKIEQLERELHERPWCGPKHEAADRERRESVASAYEAVRKLEARVIEAEKTALQLGSDVKQALGGIEDLKKMMRQLGKDVASVRLAVRAGTPLARQQSGQPPAGEDEE